MQKLAWDPSSATPPTDWWLCNSPQPHYPHLQNGVVTVTASEDGHQEWKWQQYLSILSKAVSHVLKADWWLKETEGEAMTKGNIWGGGTLNRWYHFKQVGYFRNPVFKTGSCFEMPGLKQREKNAPHQSRNTNKKEKKKTILAVNISRKK